MDRKTAQQKRLELEIRQNPSTWKLIRSNQVIANGTGLLGTAKSSGNLMNLGTTDTTIRELIYVSQPNNEPQESDIVEVKNKQYYVQKYDETYLGSGYILTLKQI